MINLIYVNYDELLKKPENIPLLVRIKFLTKCYSTFQNGLLAFC